MTFRTRILLACLLAALVPLVVFALGARRAVHDRLTDQYRSRVAASRDVISQDLERQSALLEERLRALAAGIAADGPRRAALLQRSDYTRIIDYAPALLEPSGLDYLLLLDSSGSVLSSGHFRSDYDRRVAALPGLRAARGPVLLTARRPAGAFLSLARTLSFDLGGQQFTLVAGIEVDTTFVRRLAREAAQNVIVSLEYPGGALFSDGRGDGALEARAFSEPVALELPFIDDAAGASSAADARWTIRHALAPLHAVRRTMDLWFLAALGAALLLAVLLARTLAVRVNRPLQELADKTTRINLDRLEAEFATGRSDEIGTLARTLDTMVQRLRGSVRQLREAERRATVGDLARQVNHDIRNGLVPIRHVLRHLTEVAQQSPEQLPAVFNERESTLQNSIGYLENLAGNYARLSPRSESQVCDVNAIVRDALRAATFTNGVRLQLDLSPTPVRVAADAVALRRVLENLTMNAVESLPAGAGQVTIRTSVDGNTSGRRALIRVIDTGSGMDAGTLEHIFDDFFTTRDRGTGLGLSIVRRIVADLGGRIRVDSTPGRGSTFSIELPAL